ncbi:hypothetical protein KPG71_18745 [Roseovarius sp. PS-C2]|uniref:hypothetical protein n=1 Tax=Roseovarius sp. PS-C2 TaxID=2820814 RepID=UPI001C0C102D|nr:hypothetical protein [Roseovarius sp. PS-C2]MBU3262064.1 hypothetical protein [Roseovarius sp. PS-C2]
MTDFERNDMSAKLIAPLVLAALPYSAIAQSNAEIISSGKIISSTSLTDFEVPKHGSASPTGLRVHELFVIYDGKLFLCHLTADKAKRDFPRATCFGDR